MKDRLKFRFWSTYAFSLYKKDNGQMIYASDANKGSFRDLEEGEDWKVMQSTGLTDSQGALIYVGDVLEFDNGDRIQIACEDWLEIYCDPIGEIKCEDQWRDLYRINDAKIIGNIHQNHELLKND